MNGLAELLLQMKNIHKKFPGVYALKNVDFDLKSGEVHALLGENGAGKSTLIKVLGGIYRAEEGKIVIQGKETLINSVADARETGISIIHQEIMLVPNMTIAENIFMGREPTTRLGGVNYRRMNTEAQALIDGFGMNIDASRKVATLSIAQQQMVEIVKAISAKAKIVVMDEPTSSLTDTEVEHLFALIKQLKAQNIGIIYISHKLEELFRICDRITVMRDGERVGTVSTEKTNRNELIKMMVGRTLDEYYIRINTVNWTLCCKTARASTWWRSNPAMITNGTPHWIRFAKSPTGKHVGRLFSAKGTCSRRTGFCICPGIWRCFMRSPHGRRA